MVEETPIPHGATVDLAIRLERVLVNSAEAWSKVQEMGLSGWDLVTVSEGYAYLKMVYVVTDLEVPSGEAKQLCGLCVSFRSINSKSGSCAKLGRMVGKEHTACSDWERLKLPEVE